MNLHYKLVKTDISSIAYSYVHVISESNTQIRTEERAK